MMCVPMLNAYMYVRTFHVCGRWKEVVMVAPNQWGGFRSGGLGGRMDNENKSYIGKSTGY